MSYAAEKEMLMTTRTKWTIGLIALVVIVIVPLLIVSLTTRPDAKTIIGYQPNIIYLPVFVAYDRGYFADTGLDVELREYPSADEMMRALKRGDVHFTGMSSLAVVAMEQDANPDLLRLLTLEVFAPEASPDAIVVQHGLELESIEDLRGKTLATWPGSTIKAYTRVILQQVGIDPDRDVQLSDAGRRDMVRLFMAGMIDAAFTFEPDVSRLVVEANGVVLQAAPLAHFLFGKPMSIYPGGSAALSTYIDANPQEAEAFQIAYDRAVAAIRADWESAVESLKGRVPVDDAILERSAKMDWVLYEAQHVPEVQRLLDFYAEHGITAHLVEAESLLIPTN